MYFLVYLMTPPHFDRLYNAEMEHCEWKAGKDIKDSKAVMAYLMVLFLHLLEETEKTHENPQSGSELGLFKMQLRCINAVPIHLVLNTW